MHVTPYVIFDGRCDEAIEFYKRAVGAEVQMLLRYKDNPDPQPGSTPPDMLEKVMHASVKIGETVLGMSDGQTIGQCRFEGITLTLNVSTDDEAKRMFDGLSAGGQVHVPLIKTFFSSGFAMLADRFGVSWMLLVGK